MTLPERPAELDLGTLRGLGEERPVDSSERRATFLVVAENGAHVKLSRKAYLLLDGVASGASMEELARELSRQEGRPVSAEEAEAACREVRERVARIAARPERTLPKVFWLRSTLIPSRVVAAVAGRLAVLFRPGPALLLLAFIAATLGMALGGGFHVRVVDAALLPAYGLFLLSIVVHELGHASAAARFGAPPNDIGFTMYLIYPALYSDVTTTWGLWRRQRVIVDLGGVYFQFVVGGAYYLAFRATGWEPLWGAFLMIFFATLFSLNPVFKFDGYWLLADALGVTNLARQPIRLLSGLVRRLKGERVEWQWPPGVLAALALYSVLTFAIWAFFATYLVPVLGEKLAAYPDLVGSLAAALSSPATPAWPAARDLLSATLILLFAVLMLWRLGSRLLAPLVRRRRAVSAAAASPAHS